MKKGGLMPPLLFKDPPQQPPRNAAHRAAGEPLSDPPFLGCLDVSQDAGD